MKLDLNNFFEKNGYLHVKSFVPSNITKSMKKDAEFLAKKKYRNYLNFHKYRSFKKFFVSKKFLSFADKVLNSRMIPVGSVFFFSKPKNIYDRGSVWHTDTSTVKSNFGSYLTVAVVLDDSSIENGCLQIIPKSHFIKKISKQKANYKFDKNGKLINTFKVGNPASFDKKYLKKKQYISAKEGDLIFIHDNILHKADKNKHPHLWRRIMYYHLIKDGEPFWPGWNAKRNLIERNF